MRDVAFSPPLPFNPPQSHDYDSPVPLSADSLANPALPFDPALASPLPTPTYYTQPNGINGHAPIQNGGSFPPQPVASTSYHWNAPGPQGDPFEPQILEHHFPELDTAGPPFPVDQVQKSGKRRRRPKREDECSICGGDDSKNKQGAPERLLICAECARKWHPSCVDLRETNEHLYNGTWRCVECKICEICKETGDDARILFCDSCDKGWHIYCLDPPLAEPPEGAWDCPECADLKKNRSIEHDPQAQQNTPEPEASPVMLIDPALQTSIEPQEESILVEREQSVAESSYTTATRQSQQLSQKARHLLRDRNGKFRSTIISSDDDSEVEALNGSTSRSVSVRNRPNRIKTARRRQTTEEEEQVSPARSPKKLKITTPGPRSTPRQPVANKLVRLRLPSKGKGKAREEEEEEEPKKGLFDDVLGPEERDVTKTTVSSNDKDRFEKARLLSDAKLVPSRQLEPTIDLLSTSGTAIRFPTRSTIHQLQNQAQALIAPQDPSPSPSTPGPYPYSAKSDPNVLRIRTIRFGPYDIETWYDAPFPEEFSNIPEGRLWICEFCLKYMKSRFGAQRHMLKCKCRHPPGDEIYRDGTVSIFEVDGRRNKIYCQNLCLLSKMFLDHKSLFYDVEPFLFYVITEVDDIGARFVGYFSKEKTSTKDLNLSCIMTLPVRQRQGWGNLLIDFSYLLSRKERKVGTPERPLSALGAIGYKKYWTLALMRYLRNAPTCPRLEDISQATGMNLEDIYNTLIQLDFIDVHDGLQSPVRPSPGRSIRINKSRKSAVARRNLQRSQPSEDGKTAADKTSVVFSPPESYEISWDEERVERFMLEWEGKGYLTLKPDRLKWIPFLVSRADRAQSLQLDGASLSVDVGAVPHMAMEEVGITPNTAGAASGSADVEPASANGMDLDLIPPVEQNAGADAVTSSQNAVEDPDVIPNGVALTAKMIEESDENAVDVTVTAGNETATETDPGTAEMDEASLNTPSPAAEALFPMLPKRINALEALAAVASAVSKANPVDLLSKTFASGASNPRSSDLWGNKDSADPYKPSLENKHRSLRPPPPPPSTILGVASRQSSAKPDAESPAADQSDQIQTTKKPAASDVWKGNRNEDVSSHQELQLHELKHEGGRTSSPSPAPLSPRPLVEKDAEYAAQLALEEERPRRRSLRSTSTSTSAVPTLSSRESRPKASPTRTRRRRSPSREATPPPAPISPNGPTTRRQAQAYARDVEIATTRITRQKSTRLGINGGSGGGGDANVHHMTGLRASSRLNGVAKTPSPTKSHNNNSYGGYSSSNSNNASAIINNNSTTTSTNPSPRGKRGTRASQKPPSPVPPPVALEEYGDIDAEGESDVDADGEPDEEDTIILESVRVGIPPVPPTAEKFSLTVNGNGMLFASTETTDDGRTAVQQLSPTSAVTVGPEMVEKVVVGGGGGNEEVSSVPLPVAVVKTGTVIGTVMDEGDDDIDAEGEIDEDAEGEPDTDIYV